LTGEQFDNCTRLGRGWRGCAANERERKGDVAIAHFITAILASPSDL